MKIKEARKRLKYTQKQLSKLSGISRTMISKYETGASTPSLKSIAKIANTLDCSIDELFKPTEG